MMFLWGFLGGVVTTAAVVWCVVFYEILRERRMKVSEMIFLWVFWGGVVTMVAVVGCVVFYEILKGEE